MHLERELGIVRFCVPEAFDGPLSVSFDERAFDLDELHSFRQSSNKSREHYEIRRVFDVGEPERDALEFKTKDFAGTLLSLKL